MTQSRLNRESRVCLGRAGGWKVNISKTLSATMEYLKFKNKNASAWESDAQG